MTLETLAKDIAAAAESDAKALVAEAKAEAEQPVSYTHLTLPTNHDV